ncbi:Hpt domain-containing protein [Pseudomonas sp. W03]|uniref:Hpt domain-containing protein n=1 Tax=Pseudomonas sp. W03 TaxID=3090666 RepID=UPI003A4D29CC
MGDRHDYVALEWVKGEIAETLKQARQALESYVENPQDPTRMGFCLAYIHQVRGTLQMVEFYGAALLAEEMEHLTQALIDQRVTSQGEALEVLMQAILQLPVYLDRIQSARRDLPMVVLPLLNDLRTARGEKLLSETSLFAPDLSRGAAALPVDALARLRTAEFTTLLRKLRQMLQVALVGVIRNQDLPTNLGYMARVFARLESLCKDAPLGRLWVIASAIVEGLANGSIANGTSMRNLLRQVDREFKRLVEQGADAMNQPAPDELIKNLLFYVAKASDQSPRVRAVKDEYRLDDALPGAAVVDEERARLAGPDRDAMRSVVGALCEELVRVKDSLDLFVRSDRSVVGELESLLAPLKQIADTLAVLGFGQPRKVILDQIDVVGALARGQRKPDDATLMDVAGALLYVEATLAGMVGPSEQPGSEESRLPTTDVEQIHQVVIKEARNGLELAKDAIIEFIASQWNHQHLARVPELLTQVRGGLAMISQERAAKLLESCNRYIQEQLLVRQAVPDWHSLDTLADAMTSVEYYLERLSEDQGTQGDLILDVAEESLESLGYSLKPRPSILDAVEPPAPAPLDNPLDEIDVLASAALAADLAAEPELPEAPSAPLAALGEPVEELPDATVDDFSTLAPTEELTLDDLQVEAPTFEPPQLDTEPVADLGAGVLDEPDAAPEASQEAPEALNWGQSLLDEPAAAPVDLAADAPLEPLALDAPAPELGEPAWELDNIVEPVASEDNLWESLDLSAEPNELPAQPELSEAPARTDEASGSLEPVGDSTLAVEEDWLSSDPSQPSADAMAPLALDESFGAIEPAPAAPIVSADELSWDVVELPAAEQPLVSDDNWTLGELSETPALAEGVDLSLDAPLTLDELPGATEPTPVEPTTLADELSWDVVELPAAEQPLVSDDNWTLGELSETPAVGEGVDLSLDAPLTLDELPGTLESVPTASAAPANELSWDVELPTTEQPLVSDDNWTLGELSETPALAEGVDFSLDAPLALDELPAALEPTPAAPIASADELSWDVELPTAEQPLVSDDNWTLGELPETPALADGIDFSLDAPLELDALAADSSEPLAPVKDWNELDIADLDLPEVELPSPPPVLEPVAEPVAKPMSLAEVMAAPTQAINPPAQDVPPSLLPPPADEEPMDEELREVFIEEAGEVLETIGEHLPAWLANGDERDALTEVRRAFHTLKGSGRMVRALVIGELAWSIENLLNRVLDRSISTTPAVQQVVQDVVALMPELVEEFAANAQRQRDDVDRLAATAHALAKGQPVPPPGGGQPQPDAAAEAAIEEASASAASSSAEVEGESLDPQLLEIFRNEAETHLETLVGFLADCAQQLPQPVTDDLQRALHTLKGSAHMAGILPIAEIATPLERLMKEFKTNLLQIDLREAELLHGAERLFRVGLDQLLEGRPLAPIDGSAELLARIAQVHQERLEAAEAKRRGESGEGSDPKLIGMFLAEGMDILLDAEDLLRRWREHPQERQELGALHDELETLSRGAQMAELPQMAELADALLAVYGAVQQGRLDVGDAFFSAAEEAHEALIGMMDQVAAALQVSARPEQVEALRRLLESLAEPEQDFVDLESLTADDFPAEDEEFLLDTRPVAEEDLPDGLTWPPRNDSTEQAQPADDDEVITAADPRPYAAPQPPPQALDEEMVAIFLEEAVDILDNAGQALEKWLQSPEALAALSSLQRDLHTLKGGARMAEIREIGDLSHELESLYEGLLDHRFQHSPALGGLLRTCHDRLATQLDQLQAGQALTDPADLVQTIRTFRQNPAAGLSASLAQAPLEVDAEAQQEQEIELELPAEPELAAEAEETPATLPEVDLQSFLDKAEADIAETPQDSAPEPVAAAGYELDDEHDQELVEIFLEEGFDILESSSGALQRWMENVDNSVELEALQRDLHTLKGGARMAEIRPIGDLAHELEFLYEGLCGGRLRASPTLFELLQRCHDRLAEMLEAVQGHRLIPEGDSLIEAIHRFRASPDEQLSIPSSVSLQALSAEPALPEGPEADILDIFLEEADDLLDAMEQALGRWDAERENGALDELLRILHTLKGGARLAGQSGLGDLAHDLEQHLSEAQQQGAPWPDSLLLDVQSGFEGLQAEVDQLRQHLGETEATAPEPAPLPTEVPTPPSLPSVLPEAIMAATVPQRVEAPVVLPFVRRAQEAAQEATARRAPQELVKVPAQLLEGLVNLAGETSIFRGRVEQQVSDVGSTLTEMEATIERVRDQLRRLDTETQAQILSRHQADAERAGYEDFDPLEMDRYSQLQQLSRALFESASDLFDLKETLAAKNRDAETLLLQQARVNTELQEGLMRTRMVPFDRLVPRLRRIVRQVANELGKQVEFVVSNAEGEMDRTVLERIVAPLEHMLRNAVDHGIESGEARRLAGKPETGTIRLTLGREGGDILLTLGDDGGGIRLDAVRRKAIERGLMTEDSDLTDHEVLQFILEAGFSTAEKITQISGRGVGMDVAASEVKQLGGSISIHSTLGEGTHFNIRLPFTVSVNRALMVLSGEDLYALPLNTIEGIVRVSPYELEALYEQAAAEGSAAPRFEYAGQDYELKYLGDLLNNGQHPKLVGQSLPLPVILVRSADHAVAVQVDALAGSREIVVKGLGAQFAGVAGISGATILGDGRVVVILDLLATIRVRHAHALQAQPRRQLAGPAAAEVEHQRPTLVMVVDDSVTVRKVTSRLLERNGMNVLTAKDGVDAIAQLQDHKPDIMLLDIEMPRMDGFEVATLVRHDEQLKDLPIIMITSRTGEKHRDRALAIGVNQYLGKPYQETELLESILSLVKSHV